MAIELYAHQQKAVDELHNGCILLGGVGTGKTLTSLVYYYTKVCGGVVGDAGSMRTPIDLYVITTAKKRDSLDWEADCSQLMIGADREINVSGVEVTVDSWNNIEKYENVENAFFIFDEQRAIGTGKWSKKFIKIAKKNKWIILSATPGDTWLDYIPVFLANGFYNSAAEFKREHVIYKPYVKWPQVDKFVKLGVLVRHRNNITVHMPYEKHTTRHVKDVVLSYDTESFERVTKNRWHVYEERPLRDVAEMFSVMRKVVNTDPSRLLAVKFLAKKHKKLIVFYNFDYELEILRELGQKFTIAEWNGHKHEDIPVADEWVYLVQYVAGAEGWNCIETDAVCFYSLTYSWKNFEQAKGRIERLNTSFIDLHYYVLQSKSVIDRAILRSLKEKKNFNEKKFASESRMSA